MIFVVNAEKRLDFGKNASRRLRKEGQIPAILYGEGALNVPLTVSKKDIIAILKSETKENTLFKVAVDTEQKDAMIRELQLNPVTDEILHADFIQIAMDKIVRISVPVELEGEAVGIKVEGGFVDFITRELEIECLPGNIPENIPVDISGLHLHQSLKVSEISPPAGVKFLSDPGTVLVLIGVPHKEEVVAEEKEEEIIGEEVEPEVIKKEKPAGEEKE